MKKILFLILLFSYSNCFSQKPQAKEMFEKMIAAVKNASTYSFVLDMQERIKGNYRYNEYIVKINARPYKVYVYSIFPNPGSECLLVTGENNERAYINPNKFPFITLNLNPQSMLLRKNHQYTISQMGFNFITEMLLSYRNKYGGSYYDTMILEPDTISKGKTYLRLAINHSDFHFENYTVLRGETISSIAQKLLVNDNMILEANFKYKHMDDVKAGDIIKVPIAFGKKIELYLDKNTYLPLVQIIYDDKGLYSRIEFSSFVLNPNFTPVDFSKKNKKYGF